MDIICSSLCLFPWDCSWILSQEMAKDWIISQEMSAKTREGSIKRPSWPRSGHVDAHQRQSTLSFPHLTSDRQVLAYNYTKWLFTDDMKEGSSGHPLMAPAIFGGHGHGMSAILAWIASHCGLDNPLEYSSETLRMRVRVGMAVILDGLVERFYMWVNVIRYSEYSQHHYEWNEREMVHWRMCTWARK